MRPPRPAAGVLPETSCIAETYLPRPGFHSQPPAGRIHPPPIAANLKRDTRPPPCNPITVKCTKPAAHVSAADKDPAIQTVATTLPTFDAPDLRRGSLAKVSRKSVSLPAFLGGIVLLAFLLRFAVVACLLSRIPSSHTINYNDFGWESWEMGWVARSLVLGHGFSSPFLPLTGPTALVPPLYPYILSGIFHFFGVNTVKVTFAVLGFNSLCSSLTCIPLYFLAQRTLSRRRARIAAIAWAVYPFAIYFAADRVWDYALTSLLFTCCLLVAQTLPQRRTPLAWLGFGALYGLTVLSNPSVASLLPFLLLIAMVRAHRAGKGYRSWLPGALLATLAFLAVCAPWQVRNQRVMHAGFFIRDGFWLEFYAGNNGDTHESNSASAHPASNPAEMSRYQQKGEIAYMAEKRDLSFRFVHDHPRFFAVATLRRIVRFWTGYWSFQPSYLKYEPFDLPNVPFCLALTFFTFRGLRRWWQRDRAAALPYALIVLLFPLPYYLTHSSMDYRQPIEPVLILLVTLGLFKQRRHQPAPQLAESEAERAMVLA